MPVKVGEAEALVLVKQVLAHVALHARAHDVAPVAHEVAADIANGIHDDKTKREGAQRAHDGASPLGEQATGQVAQDDGKRQVNRRHDNGGNGVDGKQVPLRAVVGDELAVQLARSMRGRPATGTAVGTGI